jgi:beta-lactam-binding protein with PASTA domain
MLGDSIRRSRRASVRKGTVRDEAVEEGGRDAGRGSRDPGPRTVPGWLKWSGLALLVLVISFGLGYLLASRLLFPQPDTVGAGIAVPALYGMEQESAGRVLAGLGLRLGDVTEVPSLRVAPGRVVAQEPIPEQQLRAGAEVALALSAGPPEVRVPPVMGLGGRTARDLLEAAGFDVVMREVRSGEVARGRVLRTIPEAGAVLRLPATLTLLVNVGPEEIEPADPPEGDTGPVAWP